MTSLAAEGKRVAVGIGRLAVSNDPADQLIAYGLGSCVGATLYDPVAKVAGMVHVLLPKSDGRAVATEPARFADEGIERLLAEMKAAGAIPTRTVVKLAGGAAVLGVLNAAKFKIGDRNAEAMKNEFRLRGLKIAAEDLGGTRGRTMYINVSDGRTHVRLAAEQPKEL
jgi:chemotaxis protein CheD